MPTFAASRAAALLRSAVPPLVVLALAVGYLVIELGEGLAEPATDLLPPTVYPGLVALQALALVFCQRAPVVVFFLVLLLDAVLLATSGGELGTGSLGVMIATFTLVRSGELRHRYLLIICGAAVTALASIVAMAAAGAYAVWAVLAVAVARPALQYGIPSALAEFFLARERLVKALRERAELAERERAWGVEREIAGVRTAMARELHDIAAHHLSGIIVGAQAASALMATDQERSRQMLKTVQQDARTTLADLRRTVGLLRGDDSDTSASAGQPAPIPSLARIPVLVDAARGRGQQVRLTVEGIPQPLGPLAETAGYRMVQESLANAARHAAGADCDVHIGYSATGVRIVVDTAAAPATVPTPGSTRTGHGYGIPGMQERADLVGGSLLTGPRPDGGWRNTLEIPIEHPGSQS